jgi:hypothetical protein
MIVTALGSPVAAETFVIASEPASAQRRSAARVCAAVLGIDPNLLICTRCDDGAHPPERCEYSAISQLALQRCRVHA